MDTRWQMLPGGLLEEPGGQAHDARLDRRRRRCFVLALIDRRCSCSSPATTSTPSRWRSGRRRARAAIALRRALVAAPLARSRSR